VYGGANPHNAYGIVGLCISILSALLLFNFERMGPFILLFSLPGLIVSAVGVKLSQTKPPAVVGLIIGIVVTAIIGIFLIYLLAAYSSYSNSIYGLLRPF
jgi:hypothetical protein